jgi:hypothetical protein
MPPRFPPSGGQATRSRSRSEQGSISTTIFLTATLGVLRRPTVFIVKNAAAGDGHTDTVHKIKLADKLKELDLLARHFALLHDQMSIEGDWDKLAAQLASAKFRKAEL